MYEIFNKEKHSFKLNIFFGYTLIKIKMVDKSHWNVEFRFISNSKIFENPELIHNKSDVDRVHELVLKNNMIESLIKDKQDSEWKFYEFKYICAVVFDTNRTIGAPIVLPKYLKTGSNDKAILLTMRAKEKQANKFLEL